VPKETAVPFYEKGNGRIRYEMVGSGFPLLVTPGGGLNSRVSNWPTAVFNAMEAFKDDFRCITTVFSWREPKDLLEKTIGQVRDFLRSHQPATAGR
jgi:hypothetical protein